MPMVSQVSQFHSKLVSEFGTLQRAGQAVTYVHYYGSYAGTEAQKLVLCILL